MNGYSGGNGDIEKVSMSLSTGRFEEDLFCSVQFDNVDTAPPTVYYGETPELFYSILISEMGQDNPLDDYAANFTTSGFVPVNGTDSGNIKIANDTDWFAVPLEGGQSYQFDVIGIGLHDPKISLYSQRGQLIIRDDGRGEGFDARLKTAFSANDLGQIFDSEIFYIGVNSWAGTGDHSVSGMEI